MIEFAVRGDIGIRETNDDRILVNNQMIDNSAISGAMELPALVAVCDGCGGYDGGGMAAETVLEVLLSKDVSAVCDEESMMQALNACQQAVSDKQKQFTQYSEMCTTIAGCVFMEEHILIFHLGDSRVYRYINTFLAKMTMDHSAVQEMVNMGRMTEDEAFIHPNRNIITRCFGMDCLPPDIQITSTGLRPGEKYLLCTDGLWEYISEDELSEVLSSELTLEEMADTLVDMALEHGGDDNISVCIIATNG